MRINIILSKVLEEKRISHRELSRMTGIRHPTISDMCNNNVKQVPLENLAKICEVLECDLTDIIELVKDHVSD